MSLTNLFFGKRDDYRAQAEAVSAENEKLRRENAILASLVRALRDVNEHLDKRLQAEEALR